MSIVTLLVNTLDIDYQNFTSGNPFCWLVKIYQSYSLKMALWRLKHVVVTRCQ